ncbi:hypothetical protein QA612_04180 [Evansella sp. AB-P1]|uniref:TIGR03826 family flagellar region protein n=1 Tax=Evansella sp. AB-P1 TaxID=3037653 RepID=UPI00241F2321|nr:TIGR03826 family flagellar region protein [Evansella sp. AB-P1]MDG5786678.1 hypothetical protein [Evansella sp. AB-P1]
MADLENCPNCGKVFVKALRPVCNACYQEVEEKFRITYEFLRKRQNRMATMEEVHEETGVEKNLIYQFIREGRLHLSQFPNLGYPCEKCGVSIREGRLCGDCNREIRTGMTRLNQEKAFENRKRTKENSKITTYHSLDERLNRRD